MQVRSFALSSDTLIMPCLLVDSTSETYRSVLLPSPGASFNDLSTTTSQPVHANSSDKASETCRYVFLPTAQTPLNVLSRIASPPVHANFQTTFQKHAGVFFCPQLRHLLMFCLRQPTPTLQAALQKHAGAFFCPQLRHSFVYDRISASPP
jgi:hypothetical protein